MIEDFIDNVFYGGEISNFVALGEFAIIVLYISHRVGNHYGRLAASSILFLLIPFGSNAEGIVYSPLYRHMPWSIDSEYGNFFSAWGAYLTGVIALFIVSTLIFSTYSFACKSLKIFNEKYSQ